MCKPKVPAQTNVAAPPPTDAPKPMASPDGQGPVNLSQLRIGTKNNLKMRGLSGATIAASKASGR